VSLPVGLDLWVEEEAGSFMVLESKKKIWRDQGRVSFHTRLAVLAKKSPGGLSPSFKLSI